MNKSIKIVFIISLILLNSGFLFGQELWLELGDKYFDQYAYDKAINLYKGANQRGINNWSIYAKLGDCYYYTSRHEKAKNYYLKALKLNKSDNMDGYRLKYTLCMLNIHKCESVIDHIKVDLKDGSLAENENESDINKVLLVLAKYFWTDPKLKDEQLLDNIRTIDCQKINSINSNISIENLYDLNSKFSDFGGQFDSIGRFYFASSREKENDRKFNKRLYNLNSQPYLEIYEANFNNGNFKIKSSDSSSISQINTRGHESSVSISKDLKTMYYSGSNIEKDKLKYNKRGTSNLKIKRAKWINNNWVIDKDTLDLSKINLENFSVGNPVLSYDESKLYFVTCAPYSEAKGKTDIYFVNLDKDLKIIGKPVNLQAVNTMGRESFPFISKDDILYFSSDGIFNGKPSRGLLDIYMYDLKKQDSVIPLGKPYNSGKDDFAYFERILPESSEYEKEGFISSNRDDINAKGDDDIYRFKVKRKCKKIIKGIITDSITGEFLDQAMVKLIDSMGSEIDSVKVKANGEFSFNVECDKLYRLRGIKERYHEDLKGFNSSENNGNINLKLKTYPCEVSINNIEFGSDSYGINPNAKKDLSELVEILLTNPKIKVSIESYTDSRESAEYNLKLSACRAKASLDFLKEAGVNESQISSVKGFGENCPIISENEINNSTLAERNIKHAQNRRTRFILDCFENVTVCQDLEVEIIDSSFNTSDCNSFKKE